MPRKPQAKRHRTSVFYDTMHECLLIWERSAADQWGTSARGVYLASLRCAIISRSWRMQKELDGHLCTATSAVVDPALLAKVDTNRRVSRCFDLRMSEFVTADAFDENVEPTKRKSRRSLTLKRKTVSTASSCAKKPRKALRPRNETISEADYSDMAAPFVPSSTKKNNQWAYNFIVWRDEFVGKLTTVCEVQVLLKCLELGYPRRSFRSIQATVL